MSPPIDIDGSEIQKATIDGQNVNQVTIDGQEVFVSFDIPDSGDLHARYDATEITANDGDSVSAWPDETGNGFDLTAGTAPTYNTSVINGNPVVRFDGVDDFLDVAFSNLSQPNHMFAVFQFPNYTSGNQRFISGEDVGERHNFNTGLNDNYTLFAGTGFDTGYAVDNNAHIMAALYDGLGSRFREDGTILAQGDSGTEPMGGITLGADASNDVFGEVDVAELLVYPQDKSGIAPEIESYLSGKWGITI